MDAEITSGMIPPAIASDPVEKWCSFLRNSPRTINATATVPAVESILRVTRRLVASSIPLVSSSNGTNAIFGPIPISSRRNRSATTATSIDLTSISRQRSF